MSMSFNVTVTALMIVMIALRIASTWLDDQADKAAGRRPVYRLVMRLVPAAAFITAVVGTAGESAGLLLLAWTITAGWLAVGLICQWRWRKSAARIFGDCTMETNPQTRTEEVFNRLGHMSEDNFRRLVRKKAIFGLMIVGLILAAVLIRM
jgi:small-conductance mechanosensitive channel